MNSKPEVLLEFDLADIVLVGAEENLTMQISHPPLYGVSGPVHGMEAIYLVSSSGLVTPISVKDRNVKLVFGDG